MIMKDMIERNVILVLSVTIMACYIPIQKVAATNVILNKVKMINSIKRARFFQLSLMLYLCVVMLTGCGQSNTSTTSNQEEIISIIKEVETFRDRPSLYVESDIIRLYYQLVKKRDSIDSNLINEYNDALTFVEQKIEHILCNNVNDNILPLQLKDFRESQNQFSITMVAKPISKRSELIYDATFVMINDKWSFSNIARMDTPSEDASTSYTLSSPSTEINGKEPSDAFVSDTPESKWNKYGNYYGNLLYSFKEPKLYHVGQLTSQGDWIYYFQHGHIMKKNISSAEIVNITDAQSPTSLNVIGDFIYYLENNTIFKIRTDGELKEPLYTDILSEYFMVSDEAIAYVSGEQISSKKYNYSIKVCNLENSRQFTLDLETNSMPQLISIHSSDVYFCIKYPEYGLISVYKIDVNTNHYEEVYTHQFDNTIAGQYVTHMVCDGNSFVLSQNDTDSISINIKYNMETKDLTEYDANIGYGKDAGRLVGMYDGNFVVLLSKAAVILDETELYTLATTSAKNLYKETFGKIIIDDERFEDIYILDDRLYYTTHEENSHQYGSYTIYSVKMDGTDWKIFSD